MSAAGPARSSDSENFGIRSSPFPDYAFKTVEFRIKVTINADGTWSYDEDTVMMIRGKAEPFHHTDRNTLTKLEEPTPNPLAMAKRGAPIGNRRAA